MFANVGRVFQRRPTFYIWNWHITALSFSVIWQKLTVGDSYNWYSNEVNYVNTKSL
jgi:hypothetical protein